jgi:hypothetical protein
MATYGPQYVDYILDGTQPALQVNPESEMLRVERMATLDLYKRQDVDGNGTTRDLGTCKLMTEHQRYQGEDIRRRFRQSATVLWKSPSACYINRHSSHVV